MGCGYSKLGGTLAALACALIGVSACAKSEDPPNNGQTHWLQSCEDDRDCGDLSCECGICTIVCSSDRACASRPDLSCRSAATLESAGECQGDPAETMLCLTPELAPTPDAGESRMDAGPDADADADVDAEAETLDADTADANARDASDRPPLSDALQIGCDAIESDELPPGIELIDTAVNSNFSHIRASEDAIAWMTLEGTHYRVGGGSVESILDLLPHLALDGADALYASATGVAARSLVSGDVISIAAEPSAPSVNAITPAGDFVYWASTDASDSQLRHLWRSARDGSATIEIGAYRGNEAPYALAVLGQHVYFARATGGGNIVHSVARAYADGSDAIENVSDPIDSLANLVTDGTSLFATISPPDTSEGPSPGPHRVVRMEIDGTVTTLFETTKIWWYPIYNQLAVDETYLYWIGRSSPSVEDTEQSIWRARKDGTGEPQRVAGGLPDGETFIAIDSSTIYVALYCTNGVPILSIAKPQ